MFNPPEASKQNVDINSCSKFSAIVKNQFDL